MSVNLKGSNLLTVKLLNKLPVYLSAEPYEVWISVALFLTGIGTLVNPKASGGVGKILPRWEIYSWGTCLLLGSSLTLYGLIASSYSKDSLSKRLNREWERLGQLILAIATALWSAVIFSFGVVGIASGMFTLFFSLVCFTRALIIKTLESYVPLSRIDALISLRDLDKKIKSTQKDKDGA